jgi:hypothetical protein
MTVAVNLPRMLPPAVGRFLHTLGRSPTRDWIAARDRADGTGPRLAEAAQGGVESLVHALGLREENRMIELAVDRLIDGVTWFAQNSSGAHGINARDLGAMRLLATWCALAILVDDQLAPAAREVLLGPFHGMVGSPGRETKANG